MDLKRQNSSRILTPTNNTYILMINTFKWIVFLKVMDKKPLQTWEEFKMYEQIFGKHYFQP